MNNKDNKGLGKGLSALIGNRASREAGPAPAPEAPPSQNKYHELPISQICANPSQPRTLFDEASLSELAQSISSVGLVQPVLVRRQGQAFELVAGERRWRAAKLAGLEKIPAVIRDADDGEALELALIENINRENLNAIDTARAYAALQEEFGATQEELAARMGRSRSSIANTMRLLDLPDEVQALVEQGKLSEGHGRALLAVSDRLKQKKLAGLVVSKGLSVRQTEELARKENAAREKKLPRPAPVDQELMDETIDALYSAFRLPVKVRWAGKTGKIEVAFSSEEQLRKIVEVLENTVD